MDTDGRWFALAKHNALWYKIDNTGAGDYTAAAQRRSLREQAIDSVTSNSLGVPDTIDVLEDLIPNIMTLLKPPLMHVQQQRYSLTDEMFDEMSDVDRAEVEEYEASRRVAVRKQFVFQSGVVAPTPFDLFESASMLSSKAFDVIESASQAEATALKDRCEAALQGGEHSVFAHSCDYFLEGSDAQGDGSVPRRCLFYRDLVTGGYNDDYATHTSDDLIAAFRRLCVLSAHEVTLNFADDESEHAAETTETAETAGSHDASH